MVILYFFLLGLHRLVCRRMIEMAWCYRYLWLGWRQTTKAILSPYYGFHLCGYVVSRLLYFSPADVFRGDGEKYERLRATAKRWKIHHLYDLEPISDENTRPWGSPEERRGSSL